MQVQHFIFLTAMFFTNLIGRMINDVYTYLICKIDSLESMYVIC